MRNKVCWLVFGLLLLCPSLTNADTEIINFRLGPEQLRPVAPAIAKLEAGSEIILLAPNDPVTFDLSSSTPGGMFKLDIPQARYDGAWTIRVSWPGSHPARISISPLSFSMIEVFASPLSPWMYHPLLDSLPSVRKYLRPASRRAESGPILRRLPDSTGTGSEVGPGSSGHTEKHGANEHRDTKQNIYATDFHVPLSIVLEPLVFGAIPQSTLPTILVIITLAAGVGSLVPRFIRWLEDAVNAVNVEDGAEKSLKVQ